MFGQYKVSDADSNLNLGCGQPGPEFMIKALELFNESSMNKIQADFYDVMQYGKKDGHDIFKLSIIQEMFSDLIGVRSEHIFMTNGVSQGVQMITSLLRPNISTIYVEELTYFIMLTHFKDLKFNIKTFSLDKLEEFKPNISDMIYIIPFCANPTGKNITQKQLDDFIDIVIDYDLLVLSDETYYKMQNSNIKPLYLYSTNIISFHTFSKIYAPGVRLGWLMTRDDKLLNLLNVSGFIDSGGSLNPLMGYMISMVITDKLYPQFLKDINCTLDSRRELICQVLDIYPNFFSYEKPEGGYFIFVKINEKWGIDSDEFLEICKSFGISFHQGWKFTTDELKDKYKYHFRLSASYYCYDEILMYFALRMEKCIEELKNQYHKRNTTTYVLGHNGRLGSLICTELKNRSMKYKPINRDFYLQQITMHDIIVDVSSPEGTKTLLEKLQEINIYPKIIIGTTGDLPMNLIASYSGEIIIRSNFSEGVPLVLSFLDKFDKSIWKSIEIKDFHHVNKKDSPSGTAKSIKSKLVENGHEDIQVDSYREGDIIGIHEIILSNDVESITIKHEAKDRRIFAIGCVNLICKSIL
jgi:4-hydroxy-tetrahydrodipicolinate reductase